MTDTKQNNRPNVGENIRYLGHLAEELLNDATKTEQVSETQENTPASIPAVTVSGNHNIISTDNGKIVVVKESSHKFWALIILPFLFF